MMKRAYKTPKAKLIDFVYDEQVTAASGGAVGLLGDPKQVGLCQQGDPSLCLIYWSSDYVAVTTCKEEPRPYSLRNIV